MVPLMKALEEMVPDVQFTFRLGSVKELEQLLSLLEAQDYPVNRIILMNTEEACFPAEILKDHPKAEVHHVTRAEFDHGGTRDQGIRMSDADVVICMTQDAIPADEHMAGTLLKAFDDPEVWAAYAKRELQGSGKIYKKF